MSSIRYWKCYFGCKTNALLHRFPNPVHNEERFDMWTKVLDSGMLEKDRLYIYNNLRLCDEHFEVCSRTPIGQLVRNAIPTLNLCKFGETDPKEQKSDLHSSSTLDNSPLTGLLDVDNFKTEIVGDETSTSRQIVAGISGKMISTQVSSLLTPQINISLNEIATDFDMNDDTFQNDSKANISLATIDNAKVTEQSSRVIIAKVYNYLQKEYEYMKTILGGSCNLSPFADILKRTAEATGVTEYTVTSILEDTQPTEHDIKLEHVLDKQQSSNEENHETYWFENSTKIETDITDEVHIIDLRTDKPINLPKVKSGGPTTRLQTYSRKSLPLVKLIKSDLLIRSPLSKRGQKIIRSDILKKLPHCQWCILRQKGYHNKWMCEQCNESLGIHQIYKNYKTLS